MSRAADPLVWGTAALVALLVAMPSLSPVFARLFPGIAPPVYQRDGFLALFAAHAALVGLAGLASGAVGLGLAILVTRAAGRPFRGLVDAAAVIGQAIPPVAVLAVAVPALGFGAWPTVIALALYGLLPVVENAVAGLDSVSPAVREAAAGIGLSPGQMLYRVELPLALPSILAGLRISTIINIGTAAVGAAVGARSLGTPIITGLVMSKPSYILQGAVPLALFALLTDRAFDRLGRALAPRRGGGR